MPGVSSAQFDRKKHDCPVSATKPQLSGSKWPLQQKTPLSSFKCPMQQKTQLPHIFYNKSVTRFMKSRFLKLIDEIPGNFTKL